MEIVKGKPTKRPPVSGLSPLSKKSFTPGISPRKVPPPALASRLKNLSIPLQAQNGQSVNEKNRSQERARPREEQIEKLPTTNLVIEEVLGSSELYDVSLRCSADDDTSSTVTLGLASIFLIQLEGFWSQTLVEVGAKIRVFGYFADDENNDKKIVISDTNNNFLLVYPDVLVQCTTVAQGLYCRRKTILNDRFKGLEGSNRAMLIGILAHSLFQDLLKNVSGGKTATLEWLKKRLKFYLADRSILDQLFDLQLEINALQDDLKPYMEQILNWIQQYFVKKKPLYNVQSFGGLSSIVATGVRDIEENIWCPKFGIRGRVDVTLEVQHNSGRSQSSKTLLPLELKTGRTSKGADHQGQVILYNLMLSSLKNASIISKGYLLYLKDGAGHQVNSNQQALRGILQLRNELAFYLAEPTSLSTNKFVERKFLLPEPLNDTRTCSKCPQLLNCAMWQKGPEKKLHNSFPDNHTMKNLVPEVLAHLTEAHMDYFWRWMRWIEIEKEAASKQKSKTRNIWNVEAETRQENGEALANLRIDTVEEQKRDGSEAELASSFVISFHRNDSSPIVIGIGDIMVVSSTTRDHFAIMMGAVVGVTNKSISIKTDKAPNRLMVTDMFRMDKYHSTGTFQTNFSNLSRLMESSPNAMKLRELIIDRRAPVFLDKLPSETMRTMKPHLSKSLNRGQVQAIAKVFRAKDYVLVRGLPGSGKTKTIAAIINAVVSTGHSVLLTSYTHSAVDNCILKLVSEHTKHTDIGILRLGSQHSIHPDCCKYSLDSKIEDDVRKLHEPSNENRLVSLRRLLNESPVVACTALQASTHSLFGKRSFDYVIVDEATLALQSVLIGPLLTASKAFVLVGDSRQLSPLIMSKPSKAEGMDESLFSRLENGHEEAVVTLNYQYRMNRPIASLSNRLFYDGLLHCANRIVAEGTLLCSNSQSHKNDEGYIQLATSARLEDSVVFLPTPEHKDEFLSKSDGPGQIFNLGEARIISEICNKFITENKVAPENIGIICIYRRQIQLIRDSLSGILRKEDFDKVEINTVDQYQGRDKSLIFVSFVWTASKEEPDKTSELLGYSNRINVALTRAKHKLILVGQKSSLERHTVLHQLISILRPDQIACIP